MISALIIVFREMLEMTLILSILIAAVPALPGVRYNIAIGCGLGLLGAVFLGVFMEQMEMAFEGDGEFLFNAVALSLAAIMISWTVLWMKQHASEASERMKKVAGAVQQGHLPLRALLLVAMFAVMREGSEAAFFLISNAQMGNSNGLNMLAGGLVGAALALALGILLYKGLVQLSLRLLFRVTGMLLMLLAAGMASQAVWNLVLIGWLPAIASPLWDSSALLADDSTLGTLLHVLMGYDDTPYASQVLTFVIILSVLQWLQGRQKKVIKKDHKK